MKIINMTQKKYKSLISIAKLGLVVFSIVALGVGCISVAGPGGSSSSDGGVWKSADQGVNWIQKSLIPTTQAQKRSIGATDVITLIADPQDHKTTYAGTSGSGMYYTLDAGENWFPVSAFSGRVPAVAVDFKNKCVVYVGYENKVQRSVDCNRTWQTAYFETRVDKIITALAVDPSDSRIIFAGNSAGDLNMSADSGGSWSTVNRFKSEVKKVFIAPYNTKILYVGTKSSGVWKSADGGLSWSDTSETFKQFSGAFEYRDLVMDLSSPETLLYASQFGILRTTDGGTKWSKIELLTPPGAATIYSLAVNPSNGREIYYGTATTFYSTIDGGEAWKTRKLPTSRAATAMLIDPRATNVLYLGVTKLKQ